MQVHIKFGKQNWLVGRNSLVLGKCDVILFFTHHIFENFLTAKRNAFYGNRLSSYWAWRYVQITTAL